ncbi:hypothetical protein EDD11_005847 [Mortierella claussenii]|nr:hypothetical protein EDD11_005847 [Mortierella claussenii]
MNASSHGHPNLRTVNVNPYWPEYQQPSHPPALPLNYYTSPTQHQQYNAGVAPLHHRIPVVAGPPPPAESTRIAPPPPKLMNQNQVHAQTHPWRIKVYNACLACRKKKIKCDGQPTCGRCERLGFECSYIEVPQTPQSKNQKQKTKATDPSATAAVLTPMVAKTTSKGHTHFSRAQPAVHTQQQPQQQHRQHPLQNNAVETAKEIRQQRRSSTQDAASGSFPHQTSRRSKEPPPPAKDLFLDRSLSPAGPIMMAPRKDIRTPDATGQLGPRPVSALIMDRDSAMLDLYHILVNSVTIPNVSKYPQSIPQTSPPTTGVRGGAILMDMDQLNLALSSPGIPTFTVLNADLTDPDQHHSSFQKDPSANSFLDQTTPLGFVITNKSVIQYLVHVYFECFHSHWMIVDKEKFLAQLKDSTAPPDPLLLVAICAAGAKYSDHEGLCAEPGNLATIGEQFLTHARILLQDRFDMPSISTLQALLILYWCQVQTGRASLRFMYVGMAIRMAQEMGLNRPVDPKRLKDMDERELQIRKTIWWSCYQADRWTSAALGKPMVISDVDCLVDYPISLIESERYHVLSFCHMTDLAKILGKIILNLYSSTNAATCSSAVFSHLDQSLSSWIESMPTASTTESENMFPTPTSLDSTGNTSSTRSSGSQRSKSASTTPVISHQEIPTGTGSASVSASKPEPSSVGYYTLLFHTVKIMLYRPFLHNSALAPVLPFTLQSPQSHCRESAVAISEIAENMVMEQRSYRQLFNSIHISLCTAATVHRFVIASSKGPESMDGECHTNVRDEALVAGAAVVTASTSIPATLSKVPSHGKTDLYYLTLLLRVLQNCCRFSIEKNLLRSIIDTYLPQEQLSPEDVARAREEIHKPFAIFPFSIKMPLQTSSGGRSMVSLNLSSSSSAATIRAQPLPKHQQVIALPSQPNMQQQQRLQDTSSPQSQVHQYQQYQLHMRQQQAKQQAQAKRLHASTGDINTPTLNHDSNIETYAPTSEDTSRQARSISRTASLSGPSGYVTTIAHGALSASTAAEQQQLQRYQRELDLLQQQHRIQQSELTQHHQQQALQLEQAQLYQQQQQQQQNQHYMQQSQSQQHIFTHRQQISPNATESSQQGSDYSRSRPGSSTGIMSPKAPDSNLPEHVAVRNKRQSEASTKKKAKQKQHDPQTQQQQSHHDQQRQQEDQQRQNSQQQVQGYLQADSYMADASASDVGPSTVLQSLSGMGASDEIMTNNSAPSVISHLTGTTDLSGTSLEELLAMESTSYYSETAAGGDYENIDSTTLPFTGPISGEAQSQNHLPDSSNNPNHLWYAHQQQHSVTGGGSGSNLNNNQGRSDHSHRSSIENINSGSLPQYNLSNNGCQAKLSTGPIMLAPVSMNTSTTWIGFESTNLGNQDHLSPLQSSRSVDGPIGYHYPPYGLSYGPQQPVPQGISHGDYHPVPRSITYPPSHQYMYAAGGNGGATGMYVAGPNPQNVQGTSGFDASGLGWQSTQQSAPQQTMVNTQVMQQQQDHQQHMYSPRVSNEVYPVHQQQPEHDSTYYVQVQGHMMSQQHPAEITPQQAAIQQQQDQHQRHMTVKLQPRDSPPQQPPSQIQSLMHHQQQRKQNRPDHHPVRHGPTALLPPLPQMMYREGGSSGSGGSGRSGRPFSSASSNSTLINPTSTWSNSGSSNSQQESSRGGSSGRETSSGRESTSRSNSVQLEGSSGQSSSESARMSRFTDSSTGGSNESSSNTESPNSVEDISNSNESGSSSDNNGGSRSSSADPAVIESGPGGPEGVNDGGGNIDGSGRGGGKAKGSSSGRGRRHHGKKSPSPSGSVDSSTSSSNVTGSSPSNAPVQSRHYRTHQHGREGEGGSNGGDGLRSPSSGSMGSSGDGNGEEGHSSHHHNGGGSHQGGGRRKHKNKYRSSSLEDVVTSAPTGNGGSPRQPDHRSSEGNGSRLGGDEGRGKGGGTHRHTDSDSAGSGAGIGSNSGSGNGSTTHDKRPSHQGSGGNGGQGGAGNSGHGSNKNRSNRKGKVKGGKGKSSNPSSSSSSPAKGHQQQQQSSQSAKRAQEGQQAQQQPLQQ